MLKSLLLATSVVIGSGTGAIQNGAHFNETEQTPIVESQPKAQITNTSTDTYELFTITTPDVYKTQQSYTEFNYTDGTYRANILRQQSRFSNAATIIANSTSQLKIRNSVETANNAYKQFCAYFEITPYLNYTNGEFHLNLNLNLYNDYDSEYSQLLEANLKIYVTEYNLSNRINMNNYGALDFPNNEYQYLTTILNNNNSQLTSDYWYWAEGGGTDNFKIQNNNIYWDLTTTIQINKNPVYVFVYTDIISDDTTSGLQNWSPCYLDNTTIKCYVTRGGGTYEVVDLPGLLFDVLTMPFTFISRAFNVTLFPNTPYQLNIADIFIAIFAALVFIFIVKTFIKK